MALEKSSGALGILVFGGRSSESVKGVDKCDIIAFRRSRVALQKKWSGKW